VGRIHTRGTILLESACVQSRSHAIAAIRRSLPPLEEVRDPDHRPAVALPDLDRAGTEDRIDGAAF